MERVSVITGKVPVIFVSPYGADRPALANLAEEAAFYSDGNAVINRGFLRGNKVDYQTETADCGRIDHCLVENVVFEEFLNPIIKLKNNLKKKHKRVYVFLLTDLQGPMDMDILIGYGNGENFTVTCPVWAKELFATALRFVELKPYEANSSGLYTASDARCLNQLFRVYNYDKEVMSMHLWVNEHLLRFTRSTASGIADAAVELTKHNNYHNKSTRLLLY